MKLFSFLGLLSAIWLSNAFAAENNNPTTISFKPGIGAEQARKVCELGQIEQGLSTDIQRFKAVYKRYEEREMLINNKGLCGLELAYRALQLGKILFPDNSQNLANLAYNYAVAFREMNLNMPKEAMAYALEKFELSFDKNAADLIPVYEDACVENVFEKNSNQNPYCGMAIKLAKKIYGDRSVEYIDTLLRVSSTMLVSDSYSWDENRSLFIKARNILNEQSLNKDMRMARVLFSLGKLEGTVKHHVRAVEFLSEALAILDLPDFQRNSLTLTAHAFMVESLEALDRHDEATEHCLKIAQLNETVNSATMKPLFRLMPEYPEGVAVAGISGDVALEFTVNELGYVVEPKVISNTTNLETFANISMKTVKKYRYAPRVVGGKAVATERVQMTMKYRVEK